MINIKRQKIELINNINSFKLLRLNLIVIEKK